MPRLIQLLAGLCLCATAGAIAAADIDSHDAAPTWDLSDLYASPQAWTLEHDRVLAQTQRLDGFRATLGQSPADMLSALTALSELRKAASRLFTYASLKGDEDVRNGPNQERKQAARTLLNTLEEKTAWLRPDILGLGAAQITAYQQQNAELKRRFGFYLDDTLRYAPHTGGTEAEAIIAAAGNPLGQPEAIYDQLSNGDLPFPTVTLSDGSSAKLDVAGYERYRQSVSRQDRKQVFDAFWAAYRTYQGTFGATLAARVIGEEFDARARRFDSALSDALFEDNMPEAVYRTLLAEADKNLPVLHRYLKMRKRLLGIGDDLRFYDLYPPIFQLKAAPHYTLQQSEKIALDVTAVYGAAYTERLKQGFAGHWMDLYPRAGKASGAYMNNGAYDVHPYLLFNSQEDYNSLSTFLHEWGHAVHTLLTHDAQPFEKSSYSSFIAETASITNELLLADYLAAHATNNAERLYFLSQQLELIRGTFFRQAMFAKFQLAIHEQLEKGGSLSGERMTDMYCGMLREYFGEAQGVMKIDPAYCVEWAFIPHFYYGFYVFQYATSMAGAAQFADQLEKKQPAAQARFIRMLEAGASDYPYTLYRQAGLDMATPAPYEALMQRMSRIMDRIEALQAK